MKPKSVSHCEIPHEALLAAFDKACYQLFFAGKRYAIRVGERNPLVQEGWFITADNPSGQLLSGTENDLRRQNLLRNLKEIAVDFTPMLASDPEGEWPEERGWLLFNVTIISLHALATSFGQLAVLHLPKAGPRAGAVQCCEVSALTTLLDR